MVTLGEKILHYRKNMHISQDELGQKLNVSRQTISLWEKGQTLPTIDNLILLKRIFGVSLDELFSLEEKEAEEKQVSAVNPPVESITVNLSREEFGRLHKQKTKALRFGMIVNIVLFVIALIYSMVEGTEDVFASVFLGLSALSMGMCIKSNIVANANARKKAGRVVGTLCRYDMYDDFMVASMYMNDECVESEKIYYKDIDQIVILKDFYIFVSLGQSWIIKRRELSQESLVEQAVKKTPLRKVVNPVTSVWNNLAGVLNGISIASAFLCAILVTTLSQDEALKEMWMFALFIPFSLGALGLGIYLKKKADKGRPSIIIGIAMTVILFGFSMFSVFFPLISTKSTEYLQKIETYTSVELPPFQSASIKEYPYSNQRKITGLFIFEEKNATELENDIFLSEKWIRYIPLEIEDIVEYGGGMDGADYYFVYNLDTDELNAAPTEKGTYTFLNGYYDLETNRLAIVEFEYAFR